MKVTLWIPSTERPAWPSVLSWLNIDWPCEHTIMRTGLGALGLVWNQAVRNFLASDSDWLWSCHQDVTFRPDTLKRLLSWNVPLISAMVFMPAGAILPHVWSGVRPGKEGYATRIHEMADWFINQHPEAVGYGPYIIEPRPENALYKISFTSTSCLLIHRSVLEAMQDPWFAFDNQVAGQSVGVGEDRYFFENAKAAGFDGVVDRSCLCGHLGGDKENGSVDFLAWATLLDPNAINVEFKMVDPKAGGGPNGR